jgi:hypothetical protein
VTGKLKFTTGLLTDSRQYAREVNACPTCNYNRHVRKTCSIAIVTALGILSVTRGHGQTAAQPEKVEFCQVVASPTKYNMKSMSVVVTYWPGVEDAPSVLYGSSCRPREGFDVRTEPVLPEYWKTLPNGKALARIIKQHHPATVELVGTFRVREGPFDPNAFPFSFAITRIARIVSIDRTNNNRWQPSHQ